MNPELNFFTCFVDLQKAFDYLITKNFHSVHVLWGTGKRQDHHFNNILMFPAPLWQCFGLSNVVFTEYLHVWLYLGDMLRSFIQNVFQIHVKHLWTREHVYAQEIWNLTCSCFLELTNMFLWCAVCSHRRTCNMCVCICICNVSH